MGEALDLAEARLKGLGIVSAHSAPRHHGPRHPCAPCIVPWLRRAGRRLERTSTGKAAGAPAGGAGGLGRRWPLGHWDTFSPPTPPRATGENQATRTRLRVAM